jgi:protocatechuate 3,4-dioxygenase beta subunit
MNDRSGDPIPFRPYVRGSQPDYDSPSYGSTHRRHSKQKLAAVPHTVTELGGPRFSPKLFPPCDDSLDIRLQGERETVFLEW